MIHKYFDHCYLINLDERFDRLARVKSNCSMIGLEFERFPAVHQNTIEKLKRNKSIKERHLRKKHWTKGAAALVKTTENIIKDAKKRGFKSILILEDDVEFSFQINGVVSRNFDVIPKDWELIQFGGLHLEEYTPVSNCIAQSKKMLFLHCYAIKEEIYDILLESFKDLDRPLDCYMTDFIQPRGKSYCFTPNLAFQYKSFSNIVGEIVDNDFLQEINIVLKKNKKLHDKGTL